MTEFSSQFMERAIALAREGVGENAGGPFGSVVVKDGRIVGEGSNRVTSTNDPTAHAEIVAIRKACANLNTFQLDGCVIYASCEPCPMCLGAIYWARAEMIYIACTRDDAAEAGFDDEFIYEEIASPLSQRRIPIEQQMRDEGLAAFAAWNAKPDKIEY
jgi:guanine deaminase